MLINLFNLNRLSNVKNLHHIAPPPSLEILRLINEFKSYEPEKKDTYDECYRFIYSKFIYIKNRILTNLSLSEHEKTIYIHQLNNLYTDKLKIYKLRFSSGQKLITDYYKPSSNPLLKCKKYDDKCAQIYLDKSIRESKALIERKEILRRSERESEEKIKKLQTKLHSFAEIPKKLLKEIKKSFNDDSITKINKWNDKIIEIISYFLSKDTYIINCKNIDECNEKISIIIDIINSFINSPSIMLYEEKHKLLYSEDKYNKIKNKIYNLFLKHYNIQLNENDLSNPLYLEFKKENEKMIIVLQKIKLDDCKNKFTQEEKSGGKYKSYLKKNKKYKVYNATNNK